MVALWSTASDREVTKEIVKRRVDRITKFEGTWYGACTAGYILIGYVIATGNFDWVIRYLWARLSIFIATAIFLILIATWVPRRQRRNAPIDSP